MRCRPTFADVTRPLRSSTCRCWMTAGIDMGSGLPRSLTDAGPRINASTITRREGSESAWNRPSSRVSLLSTYLSIGIEHRRVNPHGRVTSTVRCGGWYACGTYRHRLSIVAPSGPTRARCDIPRSWGCARTRRQRMSFWRRKRIEKASPCTQFRPALAGRCWSQLFGRSVHNSGPEHLEQRPFTDANYSIISSAREINARGMVTPIVFAVFRLKTNSNSVGCSIGRSVGFAPLRILST